MDVAERLLMPFYSPEGIQIPSVTTEEMREIDRITVQEFNLGILQMMENAGRNIAQVALKKLEEDDGPVLILAGTGGNGGGGLSCARHLRNQGKDVSFILSKSPDELSPATANQFAILNRSGVPPLQERVIEKVLKEAKIIIDALIGYNLQGAPRGRAAELIQLCNQHGQWVISLDVPSGLDSTSGACPGLAIHPNTTVTLALPKTGLEKTKGQLYLADIGIPPEIHKLLGIHIEPFFKGRYWIPLTRSTL
jgi:NAD(P)H-hydrate epimerase